MGLNALMPVSKANNPEGLSLTEINVRLNAVSVAMKTKTFVYADDVEVLDLELRQLAADREALVAAKSAAIAALPPLRLDPYTVTPAAKVPFTINQRSLNKGEVEETPQALVYSRTLYNEHNRPVSSLPHSPVNTWIVPNTGRVFYHSADSVWFGDSPYKIVADLGLTITDAKMDNLMSWSGERTLDIFYYLYGVCADRSPETQNELVNVILGPMAAKMKELDLGFERRNAVLDGTGLFELGVALNAGLIPDGARKDLYAALIARYNVEFAEVLKIISPTAVYDDWYSIRDAGRIVFYNILSEVLEPIFSQAGAGELREMIKAVLDANPKQAELLAAGDPKVSGWAMGQVMRASPTKLDPKTVKAAIENYYKG